MINRVHIIASDFENSFKLYSIPEAQTLVQSLKKPKTLLGTFFYARPENIPLFKADLQGTDKRNTFIIIRRSNSFNTISAARLLLEFSDSFLSGFYSVDKVIDFSVYNKVYIKGNQ